MRILLDTNVVIPLEDSANALNKSLSALVRLANENDHRLVIHPASQRDVARDKDPKRRVSSQSRLSKYSTLEDPPELDESTRADLALAEATDNDAVDNAIIYAIYRDAAHILVTEDRGIHAKARKIGIDDRVHYVQQAVASLERLHDHQEVALPNIQEVPLHGLDLDNPFFSSIRYNYPGFDEWFREKARDGRRAWVHYTQDAELGALEIFKEETNPIINDSSVALAGRVLKICTFKVAPVDRGQKVGELLLKAAFQYATANRCEAIYLTMYAEQHGHLRDLCEDFGFYQKGTLGKEEVFVKEHPAEPPDFKDFTPFEYVRRFYPHYRDDEHVRKFIVPIRPEFHEILFPDVQSQATLFATNSAGNAIKQAYLCHAKIKAIRAGDIVLFYRSADMQAITSIGVVESVADMSDAQTIAQVVAKRTVYSYQDIVSMARKKTKILLFRQIMNLQDPVDYSVLRRKQIVNGYIQTIRHLTESQYRAFVDETR